MIEIYILLLSLVVSILMIFKDKKNIKYYLIINSLGVIGSIFFEYPLIHLGFWTHLINPQILGVSYYASLMYIFWITTTYRISKFLNSKYRKNIYFFYLLIGTLIVWFIDLISINLGFYSYNFTSFLRIFGIPIEITIAEAFVITIFFYITQKIYNIFIK